MKLLFAEDDRDLSRAVKTLLERAGYTVDTVYDGESALDYAASETYDGIILDWMMPKMDGLQVLRTLRARKNTVPCILLTARDAVEDRIQGLDLGADDYLTKPFNTGELMARVRALLRRRENFVPDIVSFEDLELNKSSCELRCGDRSIRLTGKMYSLMEVFMEHPRIVFSVQSLMDQAWAWDSTAEINVVWVNVSQIRKRLLELGSRTELRVYRGRGYSLEKKE